MRVFFDLASAFCARTRPFKIRASPHGSVKSDLGVKSRRYHHRAKFNEKHALFLTTINPDQAPGENDVLMTKEIVSVFMTKKIASVSKLFQF